MTATINWYGYRFDSSRKQTCAICGRPLDPTWTHGGVGKLCKPCYNRACLELGGHPLPNLLNLGLIRNLYQIPSNGRTGNGKLTYIFETLIDGQWWPCSDPCGNWSPVGTMRDGTKAPCFSVPIGFWDLDRWYNETR